MRKMRSLMFVLVLTLIASFVLTGCNAKQEAMPAASAAAKDCPPAPAVDQNAILKDGMKAAAVNYFNPLPSDSNNIKAPDVQKMIDAKTDFYGVDIRANADYVKGHLPGFVNIPFAEVGKNLDKFPKDKLIIVQCYTGQTASQVVGILRVMGYNAKNLHFGFQGVTENKLNLVQ
ncbi:MAG: rhodanese-like domain-containing protein [Mycobacterium leprae]